MSQPRPPPPDPFAAAGLEAFGDSAPAADDPFARVAGPGPGLVAAPAEPTDDPFAAPPVDSAPASGATGTTGVHNLPVTDLSQLLGGPAAVAHAPPPPAAPPVAPRSQADPFAGLPEPGLEVGPAPLPGLDQQPEPELGSELLAAAAPPAAPGTRPGGLAPLSADLALEEHSGEHPQAPFADPADVMMAGEPGPMAFDGAAFEGGPLGGLSGPDPSLALATEPTPGPSPAAAPPPPAPVASPEPARPSIRAIEPVAEPVEAEDDRRQAGLGRPGVLAIQRLRSAAVNALALVALLVVALVFRGALRGETSLGPSMLRPSTLLRALRGAPPDPGAFEVAGVRTGVYAQSAGGAVLFVRGEVVSRAPAPVGPVRVEAELVRDGQVVARAEGRAGAVPTPEEVDRATDDAAREALAATLRKRGPDRVAPGERLSFLVVLAEAPPDVSGASVRVHAEPERGPR